MDRQEENIPGLLKSLPGAFEFDLFRHNLAYDYFEIAKERVLALKSTLEALEQNAEAKGKVSSHEEESDLWQQSDELGAARDKAALVAIVFSAMCLEAVINDFGSMLTSRSFFKSHLDNLKPESKWLLIPSVTTGLTLSTDSQAYELIGKLFKTRNKLVHFKPRTVSFKDQESWSRYTTEQEKLIEVAFDGMRAIFQATAMLQQCHEDYDRYLEYFNPEHHPSLKEYA